LLIATSMAYAYFLFVPSYADCSIYAKALPVVLVFGGLGLADDLFGDRSVGGLRGHFLTLYRRKTLTTGAAKAIGGVIVSIAVGTMLYHHYVLRVFLAASLIALTANAVNLTDTRPGRSLSAVIALFTATIVILYRGIISSELLVFGPPLAIAIVLFAYDRRAQIMIGDVGSNTLGGLLGFFWAIIVPFYGQIFLVGCLIWLHWWTEKNSISRTISQTAWMRAIDDKLGVRR
jgi:UDP-GlcNAc:undecaprenyl-phosphate GlcNAc-1-phosphate transferase